MGVAPANIAYPDIRHFNARIPHYNLRKCHQMIRADYDLPTVEWPKAIRAFSLNLWGKEQARLVPYPKTGWVPRFLYGFQKLRHAGQTFLEDRWGVGVPDPHKTFHVQRRPRREHHTGLFEKRDAKRL
ncbi:hypothetical protein shim_05700 [Shimia sp. SK013]|nr:hypothetical protein shim_05700 [Shimia sp. SK013]